MDTINIHCNTTPGGREMEGAAGQAGWAGLTRSGDQAGWAGREAEGRDKEGGPSLLLLIKMIAPSLQLLIIIMIIIKII